MAFKLNAAARIKLVKAAPKITFDELMMSLTDKERRTVFVWVDDKHADLNEDAPLRDKLYRLLRVDLNQEAGPAAYDAILKFIKEGGKKYPQ